MIHRFKHDEGGTVLILALAFVAFLGVLVTPLLNYATTSHRSTANLRPLRSARFAADAAVEGAVNKFRRDPDPAFCQSGFYSMASSVNQQAIVLDVPCSQTTGAYGDVTTTFVARCPAVASSECPSNADLLIASVRFEGTPPTVKATVQSWSVVR